MKRREMQQVVDELRSRVGTIVREWDPLHIGSGAPADEYDNEIDEIVKALGLVKTQIDLAIELQILFDFQSNTSGSFLGASQRIWDAFQETKKAYR